MRTEGDRNRGTDTGCQTDEKISYRTQGIWTDRQTDRGGAQKQRDRHRVSDR